MKVIFMGTPDFAVPSFEMLIENHQVCCVVTQPDRPKGRGKKMLSPIIKEKAIEHGICVLQPEKVRNEEFIEELKKFEADIIVVVAFGQILPEDILNMPKFGCINVHGSLLPKYRGAAPIQWSVINGDKETGVTTMYMAKGLDSGDMLIKRSMDIKENDTYGSLHDRMSLIGAEALKETLILIEEGKAVRTIQNHDEMTVAPMITKETEIIDWNKSCSEIINLIRGLSPIPVAYTVFNNENLKIWEAKKFEGDFSDKKNGEIVYINKKGFAVKCNDGSLFIHEVQGHGGKKMDCGSYIRGHSVSVGDIFQ